MKRVKETLAVLFLSLVLGSCGSLMDNNILLSIHKGMTQEEAHIETSKKYNYSKEAGEFYAKIEKYKKE